MTLNNQPAKQRHGYYGCSLPPGGCGCPQEARQNCPNRGRWVDTNPAAWRPMSEAKKDGTPYLLKLKNLKANAFLHDGWKSAERLGFKDGCFVFVGQNMRDSQSGVPWADQWQFAAPVGVGGFSDDAFEGFMELPK